MMRVRRVLVVSIAMASYGLCTHARSSHAFARSSREAIARHLDWVRRHGSLSDAIGEHLKDFSDAPIKKWYDEHVKKIAKETARKKAYYLNSKPHPKRS